MRLWVPPELVCRLMSGKPVKLSASEEKALALIHRGGLAALRNAGNKVACKTIDSLVRKGLLQSVAECTRPDGSVGPGGLTAFGAYLAREIAEEQHQKAIGIV